MAGKGKPAYDQGRLAALQHLLCLRLDDVFAALDVSLVKAGRTYSGPCPIHGGDKADALNLYHSGDSVPGFWRCYTRHCERTFHSTILGFIRGVLSAKRFDWQPNKAAKTASFQDVLNWCEAFLGKPLKDIKVDSADFEKSRFANGSAIFQERPAAPPKTVITREAARAALKIPAKYFVERGWSKKILDRYDVGLCDTPGKPMTGRVVVPVYDDERRHIVGVSGRSVFAKCAKCSLYHEPTRRCPEGREAALHTKWRNSPGFSRESSLYNYWFARKHIRATGVALLCEGPGDVWRLEEAGITNGVAVFGTDLADQQQVILERSGAMCVVILTNSDTAGQEAAAEIEKQLCRSFRVERPALPAKDLGEIRPKDVSGLLNPIIERLKRK